MTENENYQVKLEIFEGPLDLLLHLIRKNEVDIFDIPIATITDQYLEYIDIMKAFNMNVAGDFLVMASTLVHIKSKMLLPDFEDDEEDDPRIEITRPLMEYMRLKEVAGELSERDLLGRDVFQRQLSPDYIDQFQGEDALMDISLFQLMDAFKKVVDQIHPGTSLNFETHKWSLKEKTVQILEQLRSQESFYFKDLFNKDMTIAEFIITFLALLELVHMGLVRVFQTHTDKDIRLESKFDNTEDNDNG